MANDILDNLNQIPEDALMQPVDKEVEAIQIPVPQQFGAVQGPIDVGLPVGLANPEITVSEDYANAADILDPFNSSTVEQIQNMAGAQFPTDIHTGEQLPANPVPQIDQGPAVLSMGDQTVKTKVGETTTEQKTPTAGSKQALQEVKQAISDQDAAMQEQAKIDMQIAEDKTIIDAQRLIKANEYASKAENLFIQAQKDAEENRQTINQLRQQFAEQPWNSFWGSKSTGDKVILGLAVGLGALGQAHVGGQNVAMSVLQSGIDDYNKQQDLKFKAFESQLNAAQQYSVQSQQAIKVQYENLMASKMAAYDQLDKQLAVISAKTNVPSAQIKAEQARAALSLKANKDRFEMEKEYDARTTNRLDIFDTKTIAHDPRRFIKSDGQPMNEGQSKEYKAFLNSAPAIKDMEELEKTGIANTDEFANYKKSLLNEMRDFGVIKGPAEVAAWMARFDSMSTRASANQPSLVLYNRALRKAMVDKLRLDSGASIAESEYATFIQTYLPSDNTVLRGPEQQKMDLAQVHKFRREYLESMRGASGSNTPLWYEGVKNEPTK